MSKNKFNIMEQVKKKAKAAKVEIIEPEILNKELAYSIQATFDFDNIEMDENDKSFLNEREITLKINTIKISDSLYEICKALQEASDRLKNHKEGVFMKWYEHIGLSKDKVSELLRRYKLYLEFPEKKEYISKISNMGVRYLTTKGIEINDIKPIIESEILDTNEIKELVIENAGEKEIKISTKPLLYDPTKIEKFKKKIKNMDIDKRELLKKELKEYKQELTELEKIIHSLEDESN